MMSALLLSPNPLSFEQCFSLLLKYHFCLFQVSLVYSCDGVPAAAVGTILAQLLAASAARPPVQLQSRGAGRGTGGMRGTGISGDEEIPVSRECNWSGPDLQHGGLLGGVLTPPHLHRQQQRHAPPSRPPQEQLTQRQNPLLEAVPRTEQFACSSAPGLATTSSVATSDRVLTPNLASIHLSSGQSNNVDSQSRQPGTNSAVPCGPSASPAPTIADDPAAKATIAMACDPAAATGVHGSCKTGPAEARVVAKATKPSRSGKLGPGMFDYSTHN